MSKRVYRIPSVRAKDRFERIDIEEDVQRSDTSIEKFDYLLVFSITEGPNADTAIANSSERIEWSQASSLWKSVVPGTDIMKATACDKLADHWRDRTGVMPKDTDSVKLAIWLSISREAVMHHLSAHSGLNIRVINTPKHIICCITAPQKLLELQADDENYRLQFKGEIDPGSEEFWNLILADDRQIEMEEAKRIYNIDEANIILENLYRAGKLSPVDLGVYTDSENEYSWSRRVHALERIADRVPVWNKFVAYASFQSEPHLRYLFNTYPGANGNTYFRPKDRLYLTKAILDRYFDFDVLSVDKRVVYACMALHDSNTGEALNNEMLTLRWVTFWRPDPSTIGTPTISGDLEETRKPVPWYLRPFSQPLNDIRDYYGEKIGLFFAWFGFYTYYLIYASILGLGLEFIFLGRGYESATDHVDWSVIMYVFLNVVWNVFYKEGWKKECALIALKWGTKDLETAEKTRAQFKGDPEKPLKRSSINNVQETHFPQEKRYQRMVWSFLALFTLISFNVGIIASIYVAEALVVNQYTEYDFSGFTIVVNFVQALQIVATSLLFSWISSRLNDYENYRTQTEYEDALITKTLFFQLINNFGVPMFTAVGKGPLLSSCEVSCLYDLRQLLYIIIVVRTVFNIIRPMYQYWQANIEKRNRKLESEKKLDRSHHAPLMSEEYFESLGLGEIRTGEKYEDEIVLAEYSGTFDSYAQSVIQYGYICFFSNAVPLLAVISCFENMVRIRIEAYTLCTLTRRPHVMLAEDEGMWGNLMDTISVLGVVSASAIICFTLDDFDEDTYITRGLIFMAIHQVFLAIKYLLHIMLEADLSDIKRISRRNHFIVDSFMMGSKTDGDSSLTSMKGHIAVNLENPSLYDLRKSKEWKEVDYKQLEELEAKRKDLTREIKLLKDKLSAAYVVETYNENTGIGETKHGLPLGRLYVRIVELQQFSHPEIPKFSPGFPLKVRVLIKGSRLTGKQAGPAWSPKADSQVHKLDPSCRVVFNQVMGPFAPIRTLDAEVIFEVVEMGKGTTGSSVATTSKSLRELLDQKMHNEVLSVKMRSDDGSLLPSNSRLFVALEFQYSRVVPLRNELYALQDDVRVVDEDIKRIYDRKNNTHRK